MAAVVAYYLAVFGTAFAVTSGVLTALALF